MPRKEERISVTLRLRGDTHQTVVALADQSGRSLNGQIEAMLQMASDATSIALLVERLVASRTEPSAGLILSEQLDEQNEAYIAAFTPQVPAYRR